MKNFLSILLLFVISGQGTYAAHLHLEKDYQQSWCKSNNGVLEYVLNDSTRVDCLTDCYAIEFDFAPKWAESIGQSLYYGLQTGKKPGVVLIMENPDKDKKYLNRLTNVAQKYGIQVWTMGPQDLCK